MATPTGERPRGFTLIELIVVIVVLGLLAGIAVVGYSSFTQRAHVARAQANVRAFANAVVAEATATQAPNLTRALVKSAISQAAGVDVVDGVSAAGPWRLGRARDVPVAVTDYSIAFDAGDGVGQDTGGNRAVVVTPAGDVLYARTIIWEAGTSIDGPEGPVPPGTDPADVIADPDLIGADEPTVPPAPAPFVPTPPTDVTSDPTGITWTGDPGDGGTWCVDFFLASTWTRQGCTTTNSWPTTSKPAEGTYVVYNRPTNDSAVEQLICPALTPEFSYSPDWGTYAVWIRTTGLPTGYDWSTLKVASTHTTRDGTIVDQDANLAAFGWTDRVLFTGGANAPASGLVDGDVYVLEISGPGLYENGCMLAFTKPASRELAAAGWTAPPTYSSNRFSKATDPTRNYAYRWQYPNQWIDRTWYVTSTGRYGTLTTFTAQIGPALDETAAANGGDTPWYGSSYLNWFLYCGNAKVAPHPVASGSKPGVNTVTASCPAGEYVDRLEMRAFASEVSKTTGEFLGSPIYFPGPTATTWATWYPLGHPSRTS